jgi:hypothetical protein
MTAKADYPGNLNKEGVPIVFSNGKSQVKPVTVALYALGSYEAYNATGHNRYREQLIRSLLWFPTHSFPLEKGITWANYESIPVYGLTAPWVSSIVQGFVLSLLVRANELQIKGAWTDLIHDAWKAYHVPIEAGGFARKIQGGVIYEEYPRAELDCVFNGMCHALIGLWEAWKSGIVPEAKNDFNSGVSGLLSLLTRFNYNGWSLYSLNGCLGKPLLASPFYQRANGILATILGMMTNNPEFSRCGEQWLRASNSFVRRISYSLRIGLDRYFHAPSLLHYDQSKDR